MSVLTTLTTFLQQKDRKELSIYFGLFISILLCVVGIIVYTHKSAVYRLQSQLRQINKQREIAQQILQKNKIVLAQQQAVKEVIAQEPNFYIGQYFNDLIAQFNLQKNITKEPEGSESEVESGTYIERKLGATLANITMKQLCDLLYKIEQNQRVYTKDLKIIKNIKNGLLDVTLIIATLEAQAAS